MSNSHFTLSEIAANAREYGIVCEAVEHMNGGQSNTNYLLHSQTGKFVLTVFENDSHERVVIHAKVLDWLANRQFPSSRVQMANNGQWSIVRRGKPIMVKRFMDGAVCQTLDKAMLTQVGQALATMHCLPCPPWLAAHHTFERLFPIVIENTIDPMFGAWLATQWESSVGISADLPQGLIHADLFWDNILFTDSQLTAIIDFEHVLQGAFAFDIGMTIVGTCAIDGVVDLGKVRVLLDSYQRVRQLNEQERQSVQPLTRYAAAMIACWRFWRYRIDLGLMGDQHQNMVRIAEQMAAIPSNQFFFDGIES